MLEHKKPLVILVFLVLSCFNLVNINHSYGQEVNTIINVEVVETSPNATYKEYPAFSAEVLLLYKPNENITYHGFTDENGFVQFYVNFTGIYILYISYLNATYEPKEIYIDKYAKNYFYEKVYKLAKFFTGDQYTVAKKIELTPKCSVIIRFPESTDINFTVESYGMQVKVTKGDTYFTLEPLDICEPELDPETGILRYPNYTLQLSVKSLEDGYVSLTLVNNGTIQVDFSELYFIPKDVTVNFHFVIFVKRPEYVEKISEISNKLDKIIIMLNKLLQMHNETIIPSLFNIENTMANLTDNISSRLTSISSALINELEKKTMNLTLINVINKKVNEIDQTVRSIRSTQTIFVNDFPFQIERILNKTGQTIGYDTLINIGFLAVIGLIVYVRTKPKETKEKGAIVVATE